MRDAELPGASPEEANLTRREALKRVALAGVGLGFSELPLLARLPFARRPGHEARAESVIHISLQGGLSHLDSFDPKPYAPAEVRGEFGTVGTKLPGEPFAEPLARTAALADRLVVIRSMTHGEAAHERATHQMLTGNSQTPALTYPSLGAVVAHEIRGRKSLPAYVAIPDASEEYLGTGYLGAAFGPFSVNGEPNSGGFEVRDLNPPKGIEKERVDRRRSLVKALDDGASILKGHDGPEAMAAFYEQAYALIDSKEARAAFDIRAEPKEARERYGRTNIGQRFLLARRLAEGGVRYVAVLDGGYDLHSDIFRILRGRLESFDLAFSALIEDLHQRGLLAKTLVLVTTEFGRTSVVNRDRGRDHWPKVFSVVAAGGGLKEGVIHGATNATATEPERDPVTPADLAATVYHLLGIDGERKLKGPGDRPIDLVREGRVLKDLIA